MDQNLLHRYMMGDATDEEKLQIMQWADEAPEHLEELKSLGIIYDASIWYQNKEKSSALKPPFKNKFKRITLTVAKVAAIFALGFILNSVWQRWGEKPKMQCVYAPAGQRAELTLEDGTQVWLNANSKIIYPSSFDKDHRDIKLQGEAYFKVTPNKHRPFIVDAAGYKIRVLGTEFNVQAYDKKKYEIDLVKGSVHVTTPDHKFADLKPGKRIFVNSNNIVQGEISHPEHFQWRSGLISFDSETLQDIFNKIQLYYDVKIICHNDNLLASHYSGKFRVRDGIEHIMRVLQIDNRFDYNISADREKITIQ
jgi:transmembrane sensor